MRLVVVSVLCGVIFRANWAYAQVAPPQCLELASASQGTQAIANVLRLCDQLGSTTKNLTKDWMASGSTLNESLGSTSQTLEGSKAQALVDQLQNLYSRDSLIVQQQVVTLNITRAVLAINEALLHLQQTKMEDDTAAYNRSKILNAVLGTSIGIVGSSMQFSNNVSVQHAGDAVSVAGGAATVAFALCTAELKQTTKAELETVSNGTVGEYINLMNPALYSRIKKQSSAGGIACRFHEKSSDKELTKDIFSQLHEMNESAVSLLEWSQQHLKSGRP